MVILLWTIACSQQEVDRIETGGRPKYMGIPLRHCGHLYDNGMHKAWAECMGVSYYGRDDNSDKDGVQPESSSG